MKTIETTITVLPDGSIQIPPRLDLPAGEQRAVLVVEEAPAAAPAAGERARPRLYARRGFSLNLAQRRKRLLTNQA